MTNAGAVIDEVQRPTLSGHVGRHWDATKVGEVGAFPKAIPVREAEAADQAARDAVWDKAKEEAESEEDGEADEDEEEDNGKFKELEVCVSKFNDESIVGFELEILFILLLSRILA